jgi:hypothetical protein
MYSKVKSEWKTYDEMTPVEQLDFRIYEGWRLYNRRLKSISKYGTRTYEYLVETWRKDPE